MRFRRRYLVDAMALLSLAFAVFATHLPPEALKRLASEGRERDVGLPDAWWADDKLVHVLLYVGPGFWCALSVALRGRLDLRGAAVVLAALGMFSAADEVSQALLERVADPADVLANLLGAAIGMVPVLLVVIATGRGGRPRGR